MPHLHPSREQLSSSKEKSKHCTLNVFRMLSVLCNSPYMSVLYIYVYITFKEKSIIGFQGAGKAYFIGNKKKLSALPQQSLLAPSSSLNTDGALILSQFCNEFVLYILLLILQWKSAPRNTWCQDTAVCLTRAQPTAVRANAASWSGSRQVIAGHFLQPRSCLLV